MIDGVDHTFTGPDFTHRKWGAPVGSPHLESSNITGQGRQESNPQPAVLETAALPN